VERVLRRLPRGEEASARSIGNELPVHAPLPSGISSWPSAKSTVSAARTSPTAHEATRNAAEIGCARCR
jgi:hypothetical protein